MFGRQFFTRMSLLLGVAALVPACGGSSSSGGVAASANTIQLSAATYATAEGDGTLTITVTRGGGAGAVSVNFATSNGTATAGADYTAATGTLSWAAGDTASKTFDVTIAAGDAAVEGDETFTVALSLSAGCALGAVSQATVTIRDVDAPVDGVFQFSAATYRVTEGAATVQATITVNRTSADPASAAASVDVTLADVTTTTAVDYTAPGTVTLNWAANDNAPKSFTIDILDDGADGAGTETGTLTLSNPVAGVLSAATTATLQIVDNDAAGTLQFATAASTAFESSTQVTFTVTRADGSMGAASATIALSGTAVAGTDFTAPAAAIVLNWAGGDIADKTFTIVLLDDVLADGSVTLIATLTAPAGATLGGTTAHTATLLDDEGGVFVFSASNFDVTEGNAGTTTVDVVVNRTGGSLGAASVDVAIANGTATVANADFVNPGTQTLNWANGDNAPKSFQITINGDATVEPDETIDLTLQNPVLGTLGGTTTATATILNDDAVTSGTISFAAGNVYTVLESAGTITINFSRTGGSTGAVGCTVNTANGTAVFNGNPNGRDYTRVNNVTVTWADGDAADKSVVITILNNDAVVDAADETFSVTISAPTGGATLGVPTSQTVHITDD